MGRSEQAYTYLKKAIIENEIGPGAPLNEMELSAKLGMSRSPIREALRALESEGVVVSYPARGSFVTTVTPYDVEEIYDLRVLHELWALERGFGRFDGDELDGLAEAFREAYAAKDWFALHQADIALHGAIIEKSGSRRLMAFVESLNTQVERIRRFSTKASGRIDLSYTEHLRIIELIRAGDLDACKTALQAHLRSVANSAIEASRRIDLR